MFFETHSHYNFKHFDKDREALLSTTLPAAGIDYLVNIGIDMPSSYYNAELAKRHDYIYAAIGFHPHDTHLMKDEDIQSLEDLSKTSKVVAIGEIGLDFYRDTSPRDVQTRRFKEQLDLAHRVSLPVIIHSRSADDEVYEMLAISGIGKAQGGIMHCFCGDLPLAEKYVAMGFVIGIGGVVTYKNAQGLQEAVRALPLDSIVLETDCPYLSPEPVRNKRNDSRNLAYIAAKVAELKGLDINEVAKATTANAKRIFRI